MFLFVFVFVTFRFDVLAFSYCISFAEDAFFAFHFCCEFVCVVYVIIWVGNLPFPSRREAFLGARVISARAG